MARLAGGSVATAVNCPGGYSSGFASRLTLDDGRRVFVKATEAAASTFQRDVYRAEIRAAAALPAGGPWPALLGSFDDGQWVAMAFEDIDGHEPERPWRPADLDRVVGALGEVAATAAPVGLPTDFPRLGGWAELAAEPVCLDALPGASAWAADRLDVLIDLERRGQATAARGNALVHCDLFAHNIVLAPERVAFVDWPHARAGAPFVDLVVLLSSVVSDGLDPEPRVVGVDPDDVSGIIAAHAGFCFGGALYPAPPEAAPIIAAKLELGHSALTWLRRRLA